MKLGLLSAALSMAALNALPALAQQNSQAQLRIYRLQAGPPERDARDWRDFARYDFDRLEKGQRAYYANRYYRDWRYYSAHALVRTDRIYRGSGQQYYCRRADGTTGKVEGLVGHMRSDRLAPGESSSLEALIGAGASRLGVQVDRGKLVCH